MASIKAKFRPSATASKEGAIYYQIIHNRVVRQIKTSHRIFESEWDDKATTVSIYFVRHRTKKASAISCKPHGMGSQTPESNYRHAQQKERMLCGRRYCCKIQRANKRAILVRLYAGSHQPVEAAKQNPHIGNLRRHVEQFHEVPRRTRHLIVRA